MLFILVLKKLVCFLRILAPTNIFVLLLTETLATTIIH